MKKTISFFIAGTDTEIGKTTISCAIIRKLAKAGLHTEPMKPVAAGAAPAGGVLHNEDTDALAAASGTALPLSLITPYLLRTPASPHIAAQADCREISISHILGCYREICRKAQAVIVEGVGGFLVPFTDNTTSADLAVQLNLPVILVAGIRLGCISHALLTAEAVRRRGLSLVGWVANRVDPDMAFFEENVLAIKDRIGAPLLGTVPYLDNPAEAENYLNLAPLGIGDLKN